MTKVEALLPAWQAAEFIQATLDSLSAQTHPNFSACVSVDLSDDDTHAICRRHAKRDGRFRVIRQSQRLGYAGNCNFLLGQSSAEQVFFAFHDDIVAPTYVETLSAALDARPQAVLAYCDLELTRLDGRREHCVYTALDGAASRADRGYRVATAQGHWWVPNRGVFRLAPARTIGGVKAHGAGEFSADLPWLFRLSLLGEFVRTPQTLCFKFYKPGSLSRTWAFSPDQHFELGAAILRELWTSDLTSREKLALAVPLTNRLVETLRQASPPPKPAGKR